MINIYYNMMINNAKAYLESCKEKNEDPEITIFNFSETLAILTGKLKEDIVCDISGIRFCSVNDISKYEGLIIMDDSSENLEIPRGIQIIESIDKCEYQVRNNKKVLIVGRNSDIINSRNVGIMANVILADSPPNNELKITGNSLLESSQININPSEFKDGKTIRREIRASKRKANKKHGNRRIRKS